MIAQEFDEFSRLVTRNCRMLSRGGYMPDGEDLRMWFRLLRRYSLSAVQYGLDKHAEDPVVGRFAPTPADIIGKIEARVAQDGRPGIEEAWALSLRAQDERQTVVWCDEMAEAFGVAKPLLAKGDFVGARMAFRETYARLVECSRVNREVPRWTISEGHDAALRSVAIQTAVEAGLLALPQAQPYLALAPPRDAAERSEGDASNAAGAGATNGGLPERVRSILMSLKQQLTDKRIRPSCDAEARNATDEARARAGALVAAHESLSAATDSSKSQRRQQE